MNTEEPSEKEYPLHKVILQAINCAKNSIVITNVDGTILWCNDELALSTGYSKGELIGENPRVFRHKSSPPEVYEEMWETIKIKQEYWEGKVLNNKKDGTLYWERLCITPVKDDNGILKFFIGVKVDITEVEKIKSKLKSEIQKTQKVINKHKLIKKTK